MLFASQCAACRVPGAALCHRCRFALAASARPSARRDVLAAFRLEGVARDLVLALKFRNRRDVARVLAAAAVRRLALAPGVAGSVADVVTWAPTSARRAGRRGFDQAELLARAVARQLGLPCRRLLFRRHGSPQTGRTRVQRLGGPAFRARAPRPGLRVLVVDDVVTTGATLAAAGEALRRAGIGHVRCVAVAATPAPAAARPRPALPARAAALAPAC